MKKFNFNVNRKTLYLVLGLMIVSVFTLTVVYAALNTVLTISGNARVTAADWDIYLNNPRVTNGSATTDVPEIKTSSTLEFSTTLNMPGDFYEFTVDVVNGGSIDAMIENVVKTPELTTEQAKYLKYEITYQNGESISQKQTLSKDSTMPIKVRIEYRRDISASDLPTTSTTLDLALTLEYVQSDGTGSSVSGNGTVSSYATKVGTIIRMDDVSSVSHNPTIQLSSGSITDFSTVSVTRTGKNLFDVSKLNINEQVNNFYIIDASINSIQFTKNNAASTSRSSMGYELYLVAGTYYITGDVSANQGDRPQTAFLVVNEQGKSSDVAMCQFGAGALDDYRSFTITKSGMYTLRICGDYYAPINTIYNISNIQLEYGQISAFESYKSQTVNANADGTVSGISSISPSMTLFTNKDVTINCEYLSTGSSVIAPVEPEPNVPESTAAVVKTVATVNAGDVITLEKNAVKKNKTFTFDANVVSLGSIDLRHGKQVYGASNIVIDSTSINVYTYKTNSQLIHSEEHGLTISGNTNIVLTVGNTGTISISITSNGKTFTKSGIAWEGTNGNVEIASNSTVMNDVVLTWDCSDYTEDIWFFGDSYFTYYERGWPYYLAPNYDNFLLSGYPGAISSAMYNDFQTALTHGKPKIAVWCLGMNDQDSTTAINSSWKTYVEKFIATCEANEITPILATVPNVPERVNFYKNEYVKNSGYRYIDFATAVGANSIGSSWTEGLIHTDNVHPSSEGAKILANQILIDLPEIK